MQYSGINYSHHDVLYIYMTYLFYSWNCAFFNPLHPFCPSCPPHLHHPPICSLYPWEVHFLRLNKGGWWGTVLSKLHCFCLVMPFTISTPFKLNQNLKYSGQTDTTAKMQRGKTRFIPEFWVFWCSFSGIWEFLNIIFSVSDFSLNV